ncbi:MAG: orotidine 5'-phosphate decarboxylase [Candidatus Aenigmarchaeota archaeon]|nr:orotidine 5'-phosphate decarboxylase [Candidatus Aenigmarchaeota archaeon]MCK5332913.1 orotidine 5'-phosphate decarboxylase [Candidatus Aenigmarchaeota archaeon]
MNTIISSDRSIIIACDVSVEKFEELVKETCNIDGIGGYKVGFQLGLSEGLPKIVALARKYTKKPIIYDHQKAGTDIPNTGKNFAEVCKNAGIDAVIFFPQAGPKTQEAWIESAKNAGLGVIVGGIMTHQAYLKKDGGYLDDDAVRKIYVNAAQQGVTDFVVPGNKPEVIKEIKALLEKEDISPIFYAPGFVAQGGRISDAALAAGNKWHAIVGRGIYNAEDYRKAAIEHTKEIL